jgi:uroporphyrinogen-III decarboxylase
MSSFWGCEVAYMPDQWPHALAHTNAYDRMQNLEVPEVHTSPGVQLIIKNARLLEERYGFCHAEINFGGPLNNAVSILGEEIFIECAAEPELAQRVLRKMGEACLAVFDQVQCRINGLEGLQTRRGSWSLGNCPAGQISASMYRSVVLPVDQWLCNQFQQPPLLHHCGLFHPYLKAYQPLKPQELDVGPGTDLRATRTAYPFTPISAYIEVGTRSIWTGCIDALVTKMIAEAAPLSYSRLSVW